MNVSLNVIAVLRRSLLIAGAVLIVQSVTAQTPLPIYESFPLSYTNGTVDETPTVPITGGSVYPARRLRNGTTATLWSIGGSPGGGSTLVVGGPAALSYSGLYQDSSTPSAGAYVRTNLTTANRTAGILFPTITSGTVYASFLINVQQRPLSTNRCLVKFETATTGSGSSGGSGAMCGVHLTSDGKLGLSKSSTTVMGVTNETVLTSGTHLVVVRYTFNGGTDDDEVALWVDPGSLGAAAGSEPAPSVTLTTGTDIPSISSFYIQAPQGSPAQVPAEFFLDEIRIATNWAAVTPTQAICTGVSIVSPPTNQTVIEGLSGSFTVVAGGTSPTFQWQVSTDGGTTWNNVTAGIGTNSQTYVTPPTALANNGDRYRVIVSVACDNSSVTSSAVTLSVSAASKTPDGVVMNDVFDDGQYNNIPVAANNSVWLQSTLGTLDASSATYMLATSQASSVVWLGFFADYPVADQPIHVDVGHALNATLVFKASNIVSSNGNFRIGLFDYADGGTPPTADGTTVANSGAGIRGYMAAINFGTIFGGNPFSLYARNNLAADLMGTTGNYDNLGGGPTGYAGAPAFQNGTTYTAVFTVTHRAVNLVDFAVNISGGGTNWVYNHSDTTYCYPRFDAIGIRSASAALSADTFEIDRFKVEVVTATPNPIPLNITSSGGNVTLTWTDPSFVLQAAPTVRGTYTNVPGATSPFTTSATGAAKFFRLFWTAN
jgi:hypothetical protein